MVLHIWKVMLLQFSCVPLLFLLSRSQYESVLVCVLLTVPDPFGFPHPPFLHTSSHQAHPLVICRSTCHYLCLERAFSLGKALNCVNETISSLQILFPFSLPTTYLFLSSVQKPPHFPRWLIYVRERESWRRLFLFHVHHWQTVPASWFCK